MNSDPIFFISEAESGSRKNLNSDPHPNLAPINCNSGDCKVNAIKLANLIIRLSGFSYRVADPDPGFMTIWSAF